MKKSKARGSLKAKELELEDLKSEIWWHPYRLQNLNAEKFVQVANKILNGENFLMEFPTIEDFEKPTASKETKK
jgi:hypothetical protein